MRVGGAALGGEPILQGKGKQLPGMHTELPSSAFPVPPSTATIQRRWLTLALSCSR